MREVGIMSEDKLEREENMLNQAKEKLEQAREKFERDKEKLEQEERLKQEKELKQEEARLKQEENMLNQEKEKIKRRLSMFELLSYEPFEKYKTFKVCKNTDKRKYLKDCKNPEECEYFEECIDPENCKNSNKCKYFQECKNHEECKYFEYCKSPNKCKYFQECEDPERDFVRSVLGVNPNYVANSYYEDLFNGFYNNRGSSSLNWLANWVKQHHKKEPYPILLKKICYYYMIKHDCTRVDISKALGTYLQSASNTLNKWNLYIDYRKASEKCKKIELPIERRGKKKNYLIEFIQKTYYESRRKTINEDRQQSKPTTKIQDKEISASTSDLPVFVDVFGGTGIVASSMNVDSAYKVVNDFDPVVIATLYALIYYPDEFLEKFRRFNVDIIKGYYEKLIQNIPASEFTQGVSHGLFYKSEQDKKDKKNGMSLIYYNDTDLDYQLREEIQKGASDDKLKLLKLIRNAWFYSQYALFGKSDSAEEMRKLPDRFFYDKDNPPTLAIKDKILEIACYFIYYHRKPTLSNGEPDYREYYENEHYNLLKEYFVFENKDIEPTKSRKMEKKLEVSNAQVAYFLDPTNLENIPVNKDFLKDWRAGLQDAIIGNMSFQKIFPKQVEDKYKEEGRELRVSDMAKRTFYYLDSPYFMTKDYAIDFNDELHKMMLDNLRGSDFDWMFSIQYKEPDKYNSEPSKDSGIKKIPSYGSYYYGFVAEYIEPVGEGGYKSTYDPKKANEYRELYVILPKIEINPTSEIFITTVDMRRYTPYGNEFIQLSMKKFLEYVHATYDATNTIRKANNSLIKSYNAPNAYNPYNPYNVTFLGHYGDVYKFAKTEYEKELTP